MELCIRQRVFAWGDTYDVYSQDGVPIYFVKAEIFTLGHQIHVYEKASGREVGSVHQRLFCLLPTFDIVVDGRNAGSIKRRFTLLSQDYDVDYKGWSVEGDFLGWDYRVVQGSREVMSIGKELFRWGDTYVLRFADPADALFGLLLAIAIDAANCDHG